MLVIMMCFAAVFSVQAASAQTTASIKSEKIIQTTATQTPTIQIKEALPDGEYIVTVNGIEQRTITAIHAREIAERNVELDKLKLAQPLYEQEISQLKIALDLSKKDAALADTQAQFERQRAATFHATSYRSSHARSRV
jgi:hypothetical protein